MESVKKLAGEIGFDDLAWVRARKLHETLDILKLRRQLGRELEIEEKDLLKRVDPSLSLREVETVLVGFVQIPIPKMPQITPDRGNLSSVSWGEDYHRVMGNLLDELVEALRERYPKEKFTTQVDTGPLCERSFANLTGAGTIGRHGNFIHSSLGSYVAIGLVLTSLKVDGEEFPLENRCGECRRCLAVCPGSAISMDGGVNPKRCVSWLTQKKGELSALEEKSMGSSLYGCDLCQLVCPQNNKISRKDVSRWGKLTTQVECSHLSELSNREFKKIYGHLSGSWRGKKVWVRNAEIILKNQKGL